jgi:large subunit ribosomal protein L11
MSKKSSKTVFARVKLTVPARSAAPNQAISASLGKAGVKVMEFCKAFNEKTKSLDEGAAVPVLVDIYKDKSFTLTLKSPTVSYLLKKAAGVEKGSTSPGRQNVGSVSLDQCKKIAQEKLQDLNAYDLEAALKTIIGAAKSIGISVEE